MKGHVYLQSIYKGQCSNKCIGICLAFFGSPMSVEAMTKVDSKRCLLGFLGIIILPFRVVEWLVKVMTEVGFREGLVGFS